MRFGLRPKLYISFVLAIILPIAALVGFYFWSVRNIMYNTPAKVSSPLYAKEIAMKVEQVYAQIGDLTLTAEINRELETMPNLQIELLDTSGRVIVDTAHKNTGKIITLPELSRLLNMSTNITKKDVFSARYYTAAPIAVQGTDVGLVLISAPFSSLYGPIIKSMKYTLFVGSTIAVFVIFLLGWFLSRGILKPIKKLADATELISHGDFNTRVTVKSRDELGKLARAFNCMAEELQKSKEAERQAEESRKKLIASVSHDLRTPLSSIRGYVEGLLDGVASQPQKIKRYLEVIHSKTLYLERLINDLFQLSRLDAGQLNLEYSREKATEVLNEFAGRFRSDVQAAGIFFQTNIPPNMPQVKIDKGRIEQVLNNLISNAVKHTPSGGTITLGARMQRKELQIYVEDSGEGINPEDLPQIFNHFYRGDKSRSSEKGGTGLGLSIAKELIAAHGGKIWAESEPGRGSIFIFTLPVDVEKD